MINEYKIKNGKRPDENNNADPGLKEHLTKYAPSRNSNWFKLLRLRLVLSCRKEGKNKIWLPELTALLMTAFWRNDFIQSWNFLVFLNTELNHFYLLVIDFKKPDEAEKHLVFLEGSTFLKLKQLGEKYPDDGVYELLLKRQYFLDERLRELFSGILPPTAPNVVANEAKKTVERSETFCDELK